MLTAERFSQLSINDQVTTALSNGQELLERIFVNNIIKLYLLDGFYVEIWYQQITNRITRVGVVNIEDVLHLYESQINITDLFR
ncbi:MAG: hypothetical protein JNL22_07230 [Bacteroidales bacterium]|jgi:hypothetical protein|nr:hypothetical protein [Bacteroidales bacterium]